MAAVNNRTDVNRTTAPKDGPDTDPDKKPDTPGNRPDTGQTVLELQTAARFLHTTPEALRKRIQRGQVEATKEGGRWMVRVDTLDRPDRKPTGHRTSSPVEELYERIVTLTEEATRYKVLAEVGESTRREAEEHYREQIAELQARIRELERRRWWQKGRGHGD